MNIELSLNSDRHPYNTTVVCPKCGKVCSSAYLVNSRCPICGTYIGLSARVTCEAGWGSEDLEFDKAKEV